MSTAEVDRVLPCTEAMRDALELLNEMGTDDFSSLASETLDKLSENKEREGVSTSTSASNPHQQNSNAASTFIAHEAALRFIVYQLTYFSINKHAQAVEALTEEVTSASNSDPVTLSAEKAEILANLWAECGKDIVQRARTSLIRKVCSGTNAASIAIAAGSTNCSSTTGPSLSSSTALREPFINVTTSIQMAEGSVLEVAPEATDGMIKVARAAEASDFTPHALLTLPGGSSILLNEDQAYELFGELDAIQRQMDSLFSSA